MQYKVSKDVLLFGVYSTFQTFELSHSLRSSLILNHAFDFWLVEENFEFPWKSGLAKIRQAGPVLLPLWI